MGHLDLQTVQHSSNYLGKFSIFNGHNGYVDASLVTFLKYQCLGISIYKGNIIYSLVSQSLFFSLYIYIHMWIGVDYLAVYLELRNHIQLSCRKYLVEVHCLLREQVQSTAFLHAILL